MPMRTLLVLPHMDDEAISCGGLIQRRLAEGAEVTVLCVYGRVYDFGRLDGSSGEGHDFSAAQKILGYQHAQIGNGKTLLRGGEPQIVGFFPPLELVEQVIARVRPAEIIGPSRQDINQEHRMLADVLEIALRPLNRHGVARVLEFHALDGTLRRPNYYLGLTQRQLDTKIAAIQAYRREQRTGSSPRAPANVAAQARVWGACCGCEFAEAYTLIHGAEPAG